MRRAASVVSIVASVAFAACYTKPGEPVLGGGNGGDGGLRGDGKVLDGAEPLCVGPSDDMSLIPQHCGLWGTEDISSTGASLVRTGAAATFLQASISSSGVHAGCYTTDNFDFVHGTSIEIVSPLQGGSGDTTSFTVTFPGGSQISIQATMQMTGLQIVGNCSGPGGFSNPAMFGVGDRFWKIGYSGNTGAIGAFVSADTATWTSIGSCALSGVDTSKASARFAATGGLPTSTRSASFDNFTTCTTTP